jgi:hypothetical protein
MNWAISLKTAFLRHLRVAVASVLAVPLLLACTSRTDSLPPVKSLSVLDAYTPAYWDTAFAALKALPEETRLSRSEFYFAVQEFHLKNYIDALRKLNSAEEAALGGVVDSSLMASIFTLKSRVYNMYGINNKALMYSETAQAWAQSTPPLWQEATLDRAALLVEDNAFFAADEACDTLESSPNFFSAEVREAQFNAIKGVTLQHFSRNAARADSIMGYAFREAAKLTRPHQRYRVYATLLKANSASAQQVDEIRKFAREHYFPALSIASLHQLQRFATSPDSLATLAERQAITFRRAYRDQRLKFLNLYDFEHELDSEQSQELLVQRSKQSRWFVLLMSVLFISVILAYTYILATRRTRRANRSFALANAALDSYKNRVRPHFLFNQLNNVYGFLIQNQWEEAKNYVNLLSSYLWKMLSDAELETWSLQEEINQLERYAELQQMSSYEHVDFLIDVPVELQNCLVPVGLLQPIVENSFKYAGMAFHSECYVVVRASAAGENLVLVVEDSGYGEYAPSPGSNTGLSVVRSRLNAERKFKKTGSWTMTTAFRKDKGTVKITMPLT